jgi:hypothetical protein
MSNLIDTENPHYRRDPHSKALVGTELVRAKHEEYLMKKRLIETAKAQEQSQATQQEQINILEQRVSLMDEKLDMILSLLTNPQESK